MFPTIGQSRLCHGESSLAQPQQSVGQLPNADKLPDTPESPPMHPTMLRNRWTTPAGTPGEATTSAAGSASGAPLAALQDVSAVGSPRPTAASSVAADLHGRHNEDDDCDDCAGEGGWQSSDNDDRQPANCPVPDTPLAMPQSSPPTLEQDCDTTAPGQDTPLPLQQMPCDTPSPGRVSPTQTPATRRTTRSSMSAPASTRSSAPPKLRGRGRGVGATAAARNVRLRREFQDRGKSLAGDGRRTVLGTNQKPRRRSSRVSCRALQWALGETKTYERTHESLPTVKTYNLVTVSSSKDTLPAIKALKASNNKRKAAQPRIVKKRSKRSN